MNCLKLARAGTTAALCAALLLQGTTAALAGGTGVGVYDPGFVPVPEIKPQFGQGPLVENPAALAVAGTAGTTYISESISGIYAVCARLPEQEYTVDCLGERLEQLAASLPDTGDYVEAKAVLEDSAKKLRAVAQANKSTTKRPARVKATIRKEKVTTGVLTPVKSEAVQATKEQAVAILDEASNMLLRSVGNSERRKVDYQQIAVAVGSNKILLRSA